MGDPAKIRKKYAGPRHPWEANRIENERQLIRDYGLVNKREIWKMNSMLASFKDQVKKLNAMESSQAEKEKEQLMNKLTSLGILEKGMTMDDVLGLDIKTVMERRLQSRVHRQGLAKSMKQARQFVVHEHITINGTKMTVPSYMVRVGEDVAFAEGSPFKDEMHPERVEKKPSNTKIEKKEKKKEDEEVLAYKEDEIIDEEDLSLAKKKKKEEATEKKEESEAAEKKADKKEEGKEEPAEEEDVKEGEE